MRSLSPRITRRTFCLAALATGCASTPAPVARASSGDLDVYEKGSGEIVVFLHGLGASLLQFKNDVDALAGDVRGVAISLRGHGRSFRPRIDGDANPYAPAQMAADVVAFLDERGYRSVHLVGNSLGGLVAYEVIKLAPERVRSLVTFGTTAALRSGALLSGAVQGMAAMLGPAGMAALVEQTASQDPEVAARVGRMMQRVDADALTWGAAAIADYSYLAQLHAQRVPYLLLRGEHDTDINDALPSTLKMLQGAPCARVQDVPGAGHFLNMEQPVIFRRAVLEHVEGASSEGCGAHARGTRRVAPNDDALALNPGRRVR